MSKTTLLITTFNRAHLLNNSLERLTHLTIPDEVMVVDDGGTDNTKAVCESFNEKLPLRYIYNNNPEWSICSMARNIGVKNAIGDVIITSEPELLFVTDIVYQMTLDHEKFPDQVISAGVIYHAQERAQFNVGLIADPFTALKDEIVEDYQTEPRSYHPAGYCKTKNMQATFTALYEKKWLMELGGWDEAFEGAWGFDDIEICTRLRINGINQHICPNMEALHQWHPHLPPNLMGEAMSKNEEYMKSKRLDLMQKGDEGLIANVGREWGIIKT